MDPKQSDLNNALENQNKSSAIPDLSYLLDDSSRLSSSSQITSDTDKKHQTSNDADVANAQIKQSTINADLPPEPPPPPIKQLFGKNRFPLSMIAFFGGIVLLLVTIPIIGFYASQQQQLADNRSRASCPSGQIFCGGCINGCRPATKTCNRWIDEECQQQGCAGNGVFAGSQPCCPGLQLCPNGRCGTSCVAPQPQPTSPPATATPRPQATATPRPQATATPTRRYCDRSSPNTNQCTDVSEGAGCRTLQGQSGSCRIISSAGANTECECATSCKAIGMQVNTASECCSNYTVVGANGNRFCANPPTQRGTICSSSSPTSQGCFGKTVGSACAIANHTCKRTGQDQNGFAICACSLNATQPIQPTSTPRGGQCATDLQSCENQPCCSGLVCQGIAGSRVCQRPQTGPDAQCQDGGRNPNGRCNRILAFRCNQWFATECLDNPAFFNDMQSAIAYVNGCGQIDIVCNSGPNENKLCGDFSIFKDRCRVIDPIVPTQVPTKPTKTPQPTSSLAQCRNLKIYRNGQLLTANQYSTIRPGDQLVLAAVGPDNATQARFIINNNIPQATTQQNNSREFILNYTVPNVTESTQFRIRAEVLINGQWR